MGKRDPNFIYIRRIATQHDLTHEINIGKPALNNFFENNLHPTFHHINDYSKEYQIDINSFDDDPRFGKEVYNLINDEGGVEIGDLFIVYKQSKQDYLAEVIKQGNRKFDFFNQLYNRKDSNERHSFIIAEDGNMDDVSPSYKSNFCQTIYYGVPGSGKSHRIDEKTKGLPDEQKLRVVFHPEYTNADFVGQILPNQTSDGIEYCFKAGPFTRILKRALRHPGTPYYLIIEEVNRGNAAAIFGDLFQLLDRGSDGWSVYGVENLDVNAFIRSNDDKYTQKDLPSTVKVGNMDYTENTSVRLPPNLSILATMNTSDQNVFTLDNAFQRRWDMELVENKFTAKEGDSGYEKEKTQRNKKIEGTEITWEQFQKHINILIERETAASGLSSMEDKRLGCWFVKTEEEEISKKIFAEKVLKYLWDDAFKFSRENVFQEEYKSLEALETAFKSDVGFGIFKDENFNSQQ